MKLSDSIDCGDEDASVYDAVIESSGRKDKRSGMQLTHGFLSFGRKMSLSGSLQHPSAGHRYTGVTCGVPVLFYIHTFEIARGAGKRTERLGETRKII